MRIDEFLLARIAEDEAAADSAAEAYGSGDRIGMPNRQSMHPQVVGHVYRWTAARVLAECKAKRNLIGLWSPDYLPELSVLAATYADHPDYDPAWRFLSA